MIDRERELMQIPSQKRKTTFTASFCFVFLLVLRYVGFVAEFFVLLEE